MDELSTTQKALGIIIALIGIALLTYKIMVL